MRNDVRQQVIAFALVGGLGFVVHATVFAAVSTVAHVPVLIAWVTGFIVAVCITWVLNRAIVFNRPAAQRGRARTEYGRYVLVQALGAMVNAGVFVVLISAPALAAAPLIALALAALCAMTFNFVGSRRWAFRVG